MSTSRIIIKTNEALAGLRHMKANDQLPDGWNMIDLFLGGLDAVEGGLPAYIDDLQPFSDVDEFGEYLYTTYKAERSRVALENVPHQRVIAAARGRYLIQRKHARWITDLGIMTPITLDAIAACTTASIRATFGSSIPPLYFKTSADGRPRIFVIAESARKSVPFQLSVFEKGAGPTYHDPLHDLRGLEGHIGKALNAGARMIDRKHAGPEVTQWCIDATSARVRS